MIQYILCREIQYTSKQEIDSIKGLRFRKLIQKGNRLFKVLFRAVEAS